MPRPGRGAGSHSSIRIGGASGSVAPRKAERESGGEIHFRGGKAHTAPTGLTRLIFLTRSHGTHTVAMVAPRADLSSGRGAETVRSVNPLLDVLRHQEQRITAKQQPASMLFFRVYDRRWLRASAEVAMPVVDNLLRRTARTAKVHRPYCADPVR
jgi:hypothetical protein